MHNVSMARKRYYVFHTFIHYARKGYSRWRESLLWGRRETIYHLGCVFRFLCIRLRAGPEIFRKIIPHVAKQFYTLFSPLSHVIIWPGEFPTQRPVTRSFGDFFDLRLNIGLSKQPGNWWFQTQSHPLCRHCNGILTKELRIDEGLSNK